MQNMLTASLLQHVMVMSVQLWDTAMPVDSAETNGTIRLM